MPFTRRLPFSCWWLLAALACYWAVLIYQLGAQWSAYEQYNYGWAVPFLCVYLLWQRIQKPGAGVPPSDVNRIPGNATAPVAVGRARAPHIRRPESPPRSVTPAASGFGAKACRIATGTPGVRISVFSFQFLLAVLALVWFFTRWLHEANPIWRLTSWALALVVISLTLLLIAQFLPPTPNPQLATAQPTKLRLASFAFPICFFLVAVPWPSGLESWLTQALMQANVSVTTELLGFAGIPALHRGNVIEIATGLVGVDEACSGIRSFQATLMISLFLGELYRLMFFRRVGLCLAGFALAFVFNIGRTFLLVAVASRDGIGAIGKWHDPAGITILVGCFLGLWLVGLALRKRNPSPLRGEGVRRTDEVLAGGQEIECSNASTTAHTPSSAATPPGSRITDPSPPISAFNAPFPALRLLSFILFGWFVFTEIAVEVWYRKHEAQARTAQVWTVRWPTSKPTFQRIELSDSVKNQLSFDEGGQCAWSEPDGSWWQMFYFRWQPSRSLYARVRSQLNKTHRPEHCLTGSGMQQVGDLGVGHYRCGNIQFALKRLLFQSGDRLLRVFYAQYEDSARPELLANYRENASQRIAAAWAGSRNYGLRILEIAVAGNLDAAQADAAVQRQLEQIIHVPLTL